MSSTNTEDSTFNILDVARRLRNAELNLSDLEINDSQALIHKLFICLAMTKEKLDLKDSEYRNAASAKIQHYNDFTNNEREQGTEREQFQPPTTVNGQKGQLSLLLILLIHPHQHLVLS
ncbi:hypothetical protein DFA_08463 [Cavenderia fasciculata]|uniref:Uncharacterized protein n=1 Tax=Cavenderia fasciculata TaxID=261658 RepID=F4Q694_CACFS|nr:uncharacterized protein DFA_08463 [Cavenderia fasciculata]EGG17468.1 hypothetical protein DFA_08463 [Cavenderia fasciculata]|eukprot:XP_004355952.1 hypothetical protein DFA_08463 [Cavenderia fasciculata]